MPDINKLHTDALLSDLSVKYRNPDYIIPEFFPKRAVKKRSNIYRIYERNFRIPETKRAIGAESNKFYYDFSTASYQLVKNALKDYVADDEEENDDLADLRAETTEQLTDALQRRMELDGCNLMTTTNWSLNVSLAAANAFNANTTVSNPIPVFDTASLLVLRNSGKMPNVIGLNHEAHIAIKNHVSVLDRIKYTSAEIDEVKIAKLLGADKYVVSKQSYDTAARGQASSLSSMWGDVAFFGYVVPNPGKKTQCTGVTFMKPKNLVKRWRVESRESDAIEANMDYDIRIISSLAGFLIKDVI